MKYSNIGFDAHGDGRVEALKVRWIILCLADTQLVSTKRMTMTTERLHLSGIQRGVTGQTELTV